MGPANTSQQALQNLQNYQTTAKSPEQFYQGAQAQYGTQSLAQQAQGLRGAITNTTSLLNRVAPSVYGRTQNSLVTDAQAGRQIQNEQAPIQQNLQNLSRDYSAASEDYNRAEENARTQASLGLQGQQSQMSYLQSIYEALNQQEASQRDEAFRQAQLAEQKRQFDLDSRAKAASGSAGASPTFGGLAGLLGGSKATAAPQQFAKGTNPVQALEQIYAGYQPGTTPYYTENVVIPALERLFTLNNPGMDKNTIKQQAMNKAYSYRKTKFGE